MTPMKVRRKERRMVQENIVRHGLMTAFVETVDKETHSVERAYKSVNSREGKISALNLNKLITSNFLKAVS